MSNIIERYHFVVTNTHLNLFSLVSTTPEYTFVLEKKKIRFVEASIKSIFFCFGSLICIVSHNALKKCFVMKL